MPRWFAAIRARAGADVRDARWRDTPLPAAGRSPRLADRPGVRRRAFAVRSARYQGWSAPCRGDRPGSRPLTDLDTAAGRSRRSCGNTLPRCARTPI